MKVKLPEPKRCCFCIPLRYGLLVWGYIKLVVTFVAFLFVALILQMYFGLLLMVGVRRMLPELILPVAMLLCFVVDTGMTIVFLIGGHQKTTRPLRVFYVYSIVLLSIFTVLFIALNALTEGYSAVEHRMDYSRYVTLISTQVLLGIAFLVIQAYIIILLRSEINKLRNSRNFRFTNIMQEGQCKMENGTNASEIETSDQNIAKENYEDNEPILETEVKDFGYAKL